VSINKCIDKENKVSIHHGVLYGVKKHDVLSFIGKKIDEVQILILSEIRQLKQVFIAVLS
jgi:hypothetical protein